MNWRSKANPVVIVIMASVMGLLTQPAAPASTLYLLRTSFERFDLGSAWEDGTVHGRWMAVYDGYGRTGVVLDGGEKVLSEAPKASTKRSETHAALVTSISSFGDLDLTLRLKTVKQLRDSRPNPWEVGWVLWHYKDDVHFYYLILKPNGWELGKEDPAYPGAQRYLVTSSSPRFPIGQWYSVRVRQVGAAIRLWVNGKSLGSYKDRQRPYYRGSVGLYDEDAKVHFDRVFVAQP